MLRRIETDAANSMRCPRDVAKDRDLAGAFA